MVSVEYSVGKTCPLCYEICCGGKENEENKMKASGLNGNFYSMPNIANETMTREDLRELLLDTGGKILTCGRLRTIVSKHLGAGIYRVTLKPT